MQWISEEQERILSAEAVVAEQQCRLTDKQLEVLHEQHLFHLFVPREYGGLGLGLPEALQVQEKLAYLDGSVGWTVTLCSGASWFVGFMEPSVLPALFADPFVCFGGSGMDTGLAELLEDGSYRITGRWKYATGAPHHTVFTANCRLVQQGQELLEADGSVQVVSFWFLRDEVRIAEDWPVMGLRATASHLFEVSDLTLPADRAFRIAPAHAKREEAIFSFPFLAFAEATLASTYLGMFKRFLDLAQMRIGLGEEQALIQVRQEIFMDAVIAAWDQQCVEGTVSEEGLEGIHDAARDLVKTGLATVAAIYPQLGMVAADPQGEINRLWRDIFTASQHMMFR